MRNRRVVLRSRPGQYFELVTMSVDGNPAVLAHVL